MAGSSAAAAAAVSESGDVLIPAPGEQAGFAAVLTMRAGTVQADDIRAIPGRVMLSAEMSANLDSPGGHTHQGGMRQSGCGRTKP